jgi:hypothetical protein
MTSIGTDHSRDHIKCGGFASAIGTQKAHNFPGEERYGNSIDNSPPFVALDE